ncbi:P-loop containing nucleoside triphosphate hydrolase protein [Flagelloscypha sp. PMI_526]|nr:P-loop containing nucleoside triphosphate hydrolase protein [Flagelloscypha sp. PMI_526]
MSETPADAATLVGGDQTRPQSMASPEPSRPGSSHHVDKENIRLHRMMHHPIHHDPAGQRDPEKQPAEDFEEPFNLKEYLQSANDKSAAAGIKHKNVGVTWENLTVSGPGGAGHKFYIGTVPDALVSFVWAPIMWIWAAGPPQRTILYPSSGVLKPGEMCLVLGCPGAGCTSFLKTVANERSNFVAVEGETLYAGISAEEMAKYYSGELVYNQEGDIHIATLSVAQTLNFALSTKTPGSKGRLPGQSTGDFQEEVLDMLLRMLNISHTKNTLVGDEFVRGVSGGERKRVSIAEMMTTRARVQAWDNSTRGLDASTALDFVKSLRVMTDVLGQTTFVTLYQAGESIYRLFDKVMVLDEGRQVYFGPPEDAREYFESLGFKPLPRQTSADYLTGCTDPNERQFASGRTEDDVPCTPLALEAAYRASKYYHDGEVEREKFKIKMQTEKADQEAFRLAVQDDKRKGVSSKSRYVVGYFGQVKALTIRQFQQRIQDRFQLYTSFGLAIVLAFILGGAFFDQPTSSNGAFTRGSVIFLALITTCLDSFGELPAMAMGRPILKKQTTFAMYRASALAVANTLADIPFNAVRILIFNLILYFMSGLNANAGAFFAFHVINWFAYLTMQGFFRTLGQFWSNMDLSIRVATIFLPNFIQYSGYTLPVVSMKRWLFWIYYIDPISYAWQSLMENEFSRIELTCDGSYVIPRNGPGVDKYPTGLGPNQVCTLFGAKPGTDIIDGADYLAGGYGIYTSDLWRRNFAILVGMMIFFQITQIIILDYFPDFGFDFSINYLRERKQTQQRKEREKNFDHKKSFTWEAVNYTVPVPGGTRRLLEDVYGFVRPGTLTALMGASGAGKTTCLDVLAQRKNIGVIAGDMLVDGHPLSSDFARGTAYAEQMDVHEGRVTVRESLQFSARLRQPAEVPEAEKDAYVEEIIELLELQDLTEAIVFTLSVEARKRLTIGVELASKPDLLLFLDEPTSGLDAQSAWNLVRFLRKLADQGQAIVCTIHQPSSLLFESFDRLLLLEQGGKTVYFGDIGSDSKIVREYFGRHGAVCPSDINPAEYMLDAIGAGLTPRIGDRDWNDIWTVFIRNNLALWRSKDYIFTRLFICGGISLWVSLSLLQLGNSTRDLQFRVFAIFWVGVLPAILMFQIEPMFIINRRTFIRESSSRIYSPVVFALGQLLSELPYSLLVGLVYWVLMVYPIGFGQGAAGLNGTGFQLLIVVFMIMFGVSLGSARLVPSLPSIQVAVLFNPTLGLTLSTFSGVAIPYPTMISFWRSWLYELNPYTRLLAASVSTELHGLTIRCNPDEFAVFNPPSGQTCSQWAGEFVGAFGGYINNPNATSSCEYCQYSVGDEFYEPLNISFDNRWRDVFIILAFAIFN